MSLNYNRTSRKGTILFDIDAIIDFPLSVVYTLQKMYSSGGPTHINYSFLSLDPKELKQRRVSDIGLDIVKECFMGEYKDKAKDIYSIYVNDMFEHIAQNASITVMKMLIDSYCTIGGGLVDCTVRCDTVEQKAFLSNIISKSATILVAKREEVDFKSKIYNRIVVGDVHDLDSYHFQPTISIAVLNYGSNLQVADNDVIILPEYITKYGKYTSLRVIDSYTDIKEEPVK